MSKALCVATKCTTKDQFVESFYRFCDESSFFVATLNQRPIGLETPFSINLADRTPMLRGLCVVQEAWASPANPFGRPGIKLAIKRLTPESEDMFAKLAQRRASASPTPATPAPPIPPLAVKPKATPPPIRPAADTTPLPVGEPEAAPAEAARPQTVDDPPTMPVVVPEKPVIPSVIAQLEQRTPGSDIVLPANPLMNLSDESLEGFVDCTVYEETGNFFRADLEGDFAEGELAEPPLPAADFTVPPRRPTPAPIGGTEPEPEPAVVVAPVIAAPVAAPVAAPEPQALRSDPIRPAAPTAAPPYVGGVPESVAPVEPTAALLAPLRRNKQRTLLMAGGAAVLAALAVFVIVKVSSSSASPEAVASAAPKPAPQAAPEPAPPPPTPAPPPSAAAAADPAPEGEDEDPLPPPGPSDLPVVGAGPCRLDVTSTPAGTKVVFDGKELGPSPISIAGPCEKHKVELKHPRYKQETRFVSLTEGAPKKLDVTLIRPTHRLVIKTNPPGATISIEGRRAGTSPTTVSLMGFSGIDVTITRAGYETVNKRIYSKSPVETLSISLKRYKW